MITEVTKPQPLTALTWTSDGPELQAFLDQFVAIMRPTPWNIVESIDVLKTYRSYSTTTVRAPGEWGVRITLINKALPNTQHTSISCFIGRRLGKVEDITIGTGYLLGRKSRQTYRKRLDGTFAFDKAVEYAWKLTRDIQDDIDRKALRKRTEEREARARSKNRSALHKLLGAKTDIESATWHGYRIELGADGASYIEPPTADGVVVLRLRVTLDFLGTPEGSALLQLLKKAVQPAETKDAT